MKVEEILVEVVSAVVYCDPICNDWVAVVRTAGGMRVDASKNGTKEGAVASAFMRAFAQRVLGETNGIDRGLAESAATQLISTGIVWVLYAPDELPTPPPVIRAAEPEIMPDEDEPVRAH